MFVFPELLSREEGCTKLAGDGGSSLRWQQCGWGHVGNTSGNVGPRGWSEKDRVPAFLHQLELKEQEHAGLQEYKERRKAMRRLDDHLRNSGIYEPVICTTGLPTV